MLTAPTTNAALRLTWAALMLACVASLNQSAWAAPGAQNGAADGALVASAGILDYGGYVQRFAKSYGALETLAKAKLFFARTMNIFKHNVLYASKKVKYFLQQNEFTDMTSGELDASIFGKVSDLGPVDEALENPDMPATQVKSVQRLGETFSSASAEDLEANGKFDKESKRVKPVVSFMDDAKVSDLRVFIKELHQNPSLAAQVSQVVAMEAEAREQERRQAEEHTKAAQQEHRVQYRPVVESNNKNFDPTMISSQAAAGDRMKIFGENYARMMMDDPDMYDSMSEDSDEPEGGSPTMSGFLSSVKGLFDFVSVGGEPMDVDDWASVQGDSKAPKKAGAATYTIDWRMTGCLTAPKNQQACNSCYAFATLALMEYFHCRQTKKLTDFSAQYVVDCGPKVQLSGCQGGRVGAVGQFISAHGIELQALYPYTGRQDQCPYSAEDDQQQRNGLLRPQILAWQRFTDMAAWYKLLRSSPLVVGINMPADFLAYGGGVHDGLDCVTGMAHAMLLVGSGQQDGQDFWLLRNSFADTWGEAGHFRLAKDAPLRCFDSVIAARAKFGPKA